MARTPTAREPLVSVLNQTDGSLLRAASDGDALAFRELFDRHVGSIRGFLTARVGPDAAEDLTVETFTVAWSRRAAFDHRASSARPWLYGIATKLLQRHRTLEARWQRSVEAEAYAGAVASDDPDLASRLDACLVAAIGRLNARDREVLLLVALAELKVVEAAKAIGISPVSARIRLHRARRALTAEIDRSQP